MDSVTEENIAKIMAERDAKNAALNKLKSTTETQLWLNELAELRAEYNKMLQVKKTEDNKPSAGTGAASTKKIVKVVKNKT